jgi:hypothetical protein
MKKEIKLTEKQGFRAGAMKKRKAICKRDIAIIKSRCIKGVVANCTALTITL